MAEEVMAGEFVLRSRTKFSLYRAEAGAQDRVFLPLFPKVMKSLAHYLPRVGWFECEGAGEDEPGPCCEALERAGVRPTPAERAGTIMVEYRSEAFVEGGVPKVRLARPLRLDIRIWAMGRQKFERLLELMGEGYDFSKTDLLVSCGTDERDVQFQNLRIDACGESMFVRLREKQPQWGERFMAKVLSGWLHVGRRMQRRITLEDLERALGSREPGLAQGLGRSPASR